MDSRFDRHELLPGWDQRRLADATVVVAGVGALGNQVAQSLALAGVGRLVLCDPDRVDTSNLSRTPLFRERDVGRLKVEAAAAALRDLAPGTEVVARPARLEAAVGLAEIRDARLVVGCLDSRTARLELAGRCGLVGAPWIDSATGGWSGEVRLYLDPGGACYGCGLDPVARAVNDSPVSCAAPMPDAPAGATAPLSAAVGAYASLMAVRFLMNLELPRGLVVLDAVSGAATVTVQPRDPGCPFHDRMPPARSVTVGADDSVARLREVLGPQAEPLAWHPFVLRRECPRCHAVFASSGEGDVLDCGRCGGILYARTTIELSAAPPDTPLAALGVPPREILAFRDGAQGISFAELAA